MHDHHRLLQRDLDGVLGPAESAAVRHLLADRPELAAQAARLHQLDVGLRVVAQPLRMRAESDAAVHERICASLPSALPVRQLQVRIIDIVFASAVIGMFFVTYGVVGTAVHTIFQQAVVLTWLIGLSLIAGLALLLAPGLLRSLESGALGRLIGRPIAIGPADVLIYRAAGLSLVVGGLWLCRLPVNI